jgi:hypothetical protein
MKLYEITEAYRKLQNCDDIPEDARRDTLESLGGDLEEKADNIACIIKENNSMSNAIKREAKEMLARASARDKNSAWLTKYLQEALKASGKYKIETVRNKISIKQNSESVETDEGFITWAQANDRDDLLKYSEPAPDKKAIKEYIKAENELPLARLIRTERLEIK